MDDTNSWIEQRWSNFDSGKLADVASLAIAGRLTANRDMGKVQLIDVKDVFGGVQVTVQKQALGA